MTEKFNILKAIDVTPTALAKSTSVVFKGLMVLGLVALAGWLVYVGLIKPHTNPTPTTEMRAATIYNVYVYPNRKGFSLFSWGTWHFVSKDSDYGLKPILYQQVVKNETK